MKILAFDTALDACSVAVCDGRNVLARRHEHLSKGHAEALVPMIQSVLSAASAWFDELDLIAVTVGPGTFAGIRVGLSAARGIALTTGVRVAGITTMAAIAEGVRQWREMDEGRAIVVLHDAGKAELYHQVFPRDGETTVLAPAVIAPTDVPSVLPSGPVTVVGSGTELVRDQIKERHPDVRFSDAPFVPDAVHVARAGLKLAESDGIGNVPPQPLYLRAPDARLPGAPAR